jgi:hypothetical protein
VLYVPAGGPILLGGAAKLPPLDNVALVGDSVPSGGPPPYGTGGSTFWITDERNTAFQLGGNWRLSGLNFFWPRQTERNVRPIAYPPLFSNVPGRQAGGGWIERLRVVNAFDFFVVDGSTPGDTLGDVVIESCRTYAIQDCFRLRNTPEVIQIANCLFSYEPFGFEVNQYGREKPTFSLREHTTSRGCFLHVVGDGTPQKASSTIAGLLTSNVFVFGYGRGVWADRGTISARLAETSFDGVSNVLHVDPGGCLVAFHHHGGVIWCYRPGFENSERSVAYVVRDPAPNEAGKPLCRFMVTDVEVGFANGSLFDISGVNVDEVKLSLKAGRFGRLPGGSFGLRIRAPNAKLELDGTSFVPVTSGNTGVHIDGPIGSASLVGNRFYNLERPVTLDGSGPIHLAANASFGTTGPRSVSGRQAAGVTGGGNAWDKP